MSQIQRVERRVLSQSLASHTHTHAVAATRVARHTATAHRVTVHANSHGRVKKSPATPLAESTSAAPSHVPRPTSHLHTMFGFLTSRWQSAAPQAKTTPTWFAHSVSPILLSVAKKACTHPIHTIVTIAFLGSYSYLGVLDKGLLDTDDALAGRVDLQTLLAGSKQLRVGEETKWQWQLDEETSAGVQARELALVTLVFPESSSSNSAPSQNSVPSNVSVERLPSSSSSFSTLSQDTSLAYSIPYAEASDFLLAMREISAPADVADAQGSDKEGTREEKKWMMRASKNGSASSGLRSWINESWTSFVDLLKVRTLAGWLAGSLTPRRVHEHWLRNEPAER